MAKEPKTKPAPAPSHDRVIELFFINVAKIADFYKKEKTAGMTYGLNTTMEVTFGNLSAAAEMARAGKEWEPA